MKSEHLLEEFNKQIKYELESAYLYFAMEAYFHAENFSGMAQWMRVQTQEELAHAAKFFDFLITSNSRVELAELSGPRKDWKSPLDVFKAVYKHEQFVTSRINELYQLAQSENDYPAVVLLQWFITEQVEEEANALKIVEDLERMGDSGHGLFLIDRELGTRIYMPPATAE
ncbi:ferritin [bacterium BMS3Abin05]|nr:ferritin [bacterium BMS3Abin05]GBE26975.1 ferritin [bacterium BMS3Bbin03]HDL78614.1 ferritin [Bacteroidota bacterium]HDZ11482.1 ferritin [Bacteroidota bacterium]